MPEEIEKTHSDESGNQDDLPFPRVSVIIPAYNEALKIDGCLESLQNLNYPKDRFEIIIVDNKSTDGTGEMVKKHDAILLHETAMQSAYAARNTGILSAKGEIIALTDADCVVDQNWLCRLVAPFQDPAVGGVGGKVINYPATTLVEEFIQQEMPYEHCDQDDGRFLSGLITSNCAYRRQDLIDVGLFNMMFDCSDIELSWRLQMKTGKRIVLLPDAVVYHKHRSSVKQLFWWQYRFGFGQILMTTLYKDIHDSFYNQKYQLVSLLRQIGALFVYVGSFFYRSIVWCFRKKEKTPLYRMNPVYHFLADSGLFFGRITGLVKTRFFQADISSRVWEEPVKR